MLIDYDEAVWAVAVQLAFEADTEQPGNHRPEDYLSDAKSCFYGITTIEPKRGRWISKKSADWAGGGATLCSCCDYGYSWGAFFEVENFNYCPNCGAKMTED